MKKILLRKNLINKLKNLSNNLSLIYKILKINTKISIKQK